LSVFFFAEADLGMFSTGQRTSDNSATFSGLWRHLYGIHLLQQGNHWLAYKRYKASEFRKPYLKSRNSSETARVWITRTRFSGKTM